MAIFEYVLRKIPLQSLSAGDLTMSFVIGGKTAKRKKKKKKKKSGRRDEVRLAEKEEEEEEEETTLSLIDYIHALTTEEPPTREVVALHRHICRFVSVPCCFIANPVLRRRTSPPPMTPPDEEEEEEEESVASGKNYVHSSGKRSRH
jgi:hypothetical protein